MQFLGSTSDGWIIVFSKEKRKLVVSGEVISHSEIESLIFRGKEAVRFFKEVYPFLPPSEALKNFENSPFIIYPYGAPPEKWYLIRMYPYQVILHRSFEKKGPKGRLFKNHVYQLRYKLSLSAYSLYEPYPSALIREGEPVEKHKAGTWREEIKAIEGYLIEEFKERGKGELLITLALKDGREITGLMARGKGRGHFFYVFRNPDKPIQKIFIFKHAVDDFWVEE